MNNIGEYKKRLQYVRNYYSRSIGQKNTIKDKIYQNTLKKAQLDKDIETYEKVNDLLKLVSVHVREQIKTYLEDAITDALQHVSQGQYECKIKIDEQRGKPSAEIYVSEMINGKESLQRPEDVCGGSFVDTISVALNYAYISLYSDPLLKGPSIFDEPGKMVSEKMSIYFAEFMKQMCKNFNRQTIMCTHNNNIKNTADYVIEVKKKDGHSIIS